MPDPQLNLVVGPNGSGKSSLMCALCLVFAGSLKALGRQSRLNEFIKWGCDYAKVEVEIYDDSGASNPVIKCLVKRRPAIQYFLNNEECTDAKIKSFAQGYDIQVDNLCQFLAQDNVVQFSRQSPAGLLRNTTEAVGSRSLKQRWKEANDRYESNLKQKSDLGSLEKRKSELEKKLSRLQPVAERCRKTNEEKQKVEQLQQKLAYLVFQDNLKSLESEGEVLETAKNELASELNSERKLQKKVIAMERTSRDMESAIQEKKKKLNAIASELRTWKSNLVKTNEAVRRTYEARLTLQTQIEKSEQSIKEQDETVQRLRAELENKEQSRKELEERLSSIAMRVRSEQQEANEASNSVEEVQLQIDSVKNGIQTLEKEIKRQTDLADERVQLLARLDNNCLAAYKLLETHRSKFKGNVWLPLLSISINSPSDSVFVENTIALRDLLTFVFEDFNDMELFMDLTKRSGLKVNAGLVPDASRLVTLKLDDGLKSQGFVNIISNMFDAPNGVKSYLSILHGLNRICVGSLETEKNLSSVVPYMSKRNLGLFFTPNLKVSTRRSAYSGRLTTRQTGLRDRKIFQSRTNTSLLGRMRRELEDRQGQLVQLSNEQKQLQRKVDECRKSMEPYKKELKEVNALLEKLNSFRDHVQIEEHSLKRQKDRLPKLKESLRVSADEMGPHLRNKLKLLRKIADVLKDARERTEGAVDASLSLSLHLTSLADAKDEVSRYQSELSSKKEHVTSLESAYSARAADLVSMKIDLLDLLQTDSANTSVKNLFDPVKLRKELESLPSDCDEINTRIMKLQFFLSRQCAEDEEVLKEYTKGCDEVERIAALCDRLRGEVATSTKDLLSAKTQWVAEAKRLTDSISERFGYLMTQLGYNGEVRLDVPDDEQAPISHCGLKIMVHFGSSGVLRELDDHHQSGGERSVSIILYMFSLQQLSVVPFRCVDEINQGMDPVNERKVFDLMVKMLSGSDSNSQFGRTQYIMFTPKLLPDCNFGEETKVWFILNGIGAPSQRILSDALKSALEDTSNDEMDCE